MDLGEVKGAFRGSIPTTLEAAILRTTASCGTYSTSQGIYSDKKGVGRGGMWWRCSEMVSTHHPWRCPFHCENGA